MDNDGNIGIEPGSETVYGTHDDNTMVMSEKVQSLAGSIYQEFERMIQRYDEDVVKTLMPLLVNVLECLDSAYQTNQEQEVELELLREDNEQLVTQYEREKSARKQAEQKLLDTEDLAESENKELSSRLESLASIVRMLELKHKNSLEHSSRLEEREGDLKKEYTKLHERYTELFKTHVDYMERTKLLMGSTHSQLNSTNSERLELNRSRLHPMYRSSGPVSYGFASLETSQMLDTETICSANGSDASSVGSGPPSLQNEFDNIQTMERSAETDTLKQINQATSPQSEQSPVHLQPPATAGRSTTKNEKRSANTLYQELSFQDNEESEENEVTGSWVHPGEYASSVNDNFFGMGKEVENLISENTELLATKNALNIVKDDLIVKVDELTGEIEILREELNTANQSRAKMRQKISELEDELKQSKTLVKANNSSDQEDEGDVPMAQRKRFTRVEMARVLMERNQYKERFMELQDAVRWTEMIRASRSGEINPKAKESIWRKFFNKLLLLAEASPHMKVFCAAGVNLNGGYTKDGGCIVGASVFYPTNTTETAQITEITTPTGETSELDSLEKQITMAMENSDPDSQLSSYVWICTSTHSASTVTVIDAKNPAVVLDSFPVCQTHLLCICSVQGALEKDYALLENSEAIKSGETLEKPGEDPDDTGRVEFVRVTKKDGAAATSTGADGDDSNASQQSQQPQQQSDQNENVPSETQPSATCTADELTASVVAENDKNEVEIALDSQNLNKGAITAVVEEINAPPVSPLHLNNNPNNNQNIYSLAFPKPVNPILGSPNPLEEPAMSSVGPTMWLGAQNGMLYVHSAVARWRDCLHQVCLPDAVLSIVHVESRVVAALANGKLAVFRRQTDGQWDLNSYHLVTLGLPKQSVRCLCIVADKIWAAHRNKIYIVDPISLNIVHILEAHPRKESQIRQMAATGLGVWVSIRLDSTLRLYHAHTYEHLQDVDIEPYVSKMLGTGKLGFSFARITALLVSCNRLWIGTGNGVVISVPLTEALQYNNKIATNNFIPRCCMANAQLSFHGHRDAVKFFVAVPMQSQSEIQLGQKPHMLVMSGGEGYIDFRLGDSDMDNSIVLEPNQTIENRGDKSYLIVWQVNQN